MRVEVGEATRKEAGAMSSLIFMVLKELFWLYKNNKLQFQCNMK